MFRREELKRLLNEYPKDFATPKYSYGKPLYRDGVPGEVGFWIDEWDCKWRVGEPGVIGEVVDPPLSDWKALTSFNPPWAFLKEADFSMVNKSCWESSCFVYARSTIMPFQRMQFLRGTENLFYDLGYGVKEVYLLRDILHEFYMEEMMMWVKTDIDGIVFLDDFGAQNSMLISPDLFREIFKPLYKEYCDLAHRHNKYVFFHSDGFIEDIYPDLIEVGIDAINSQIFCMDMERLGRDFKGKVIFWGEMDRQRLLPFGTRQEIRNAVQRVRRALETDDGGVIAMCSWGLMDPYENVQTFYEEWSRSRKEGGAIKGNRESVD